VAEGAAFPRLTMPASGFRVLLQVARKELITSLRDRQTAIYALVLPLCLYPVLFWVMVQGALVVQGKRQHTDTTVGLVYADPEAAPGELPAALALDGAETGLHVLRTETLAGALDAEGARAWLTGGDRDPAPVAGDDERPDAVLYVPSGSNGEGAQLFYDSTDSSSEIARARVEERVPPLIGQLRSELAEARGHDPRDLDALETRTHDIAPSEDKGALMLSFILPMLLVIMAVMGAFFPAVDLTAGEKERGTAETTLLLPVPRGAVHQGKILAVCGMAVVATFLNLFAIGLSAEHLLGMLAQSTELSVELPVGALVSIAPLALLYAFFVSAVLTGIAGLAASFKEGQALLGPVQIVFILPAMAGTLPGIELTPAMAFVPVLNVVLAFRSMLLGEGLYLEYVLTAASLLVYAILAIRLAVRLLSREAVSLAGETLPLRKLLGLLRSTGGTR